MNPTIIINPMPCQKCKEGYVVPLFEYIDTEKGIEACLSGWSCTNCDSNVFYDFGTEKPTLKKLAREN